VKRLRALLLLALLATPAASEGDDACPNCTQTPTVLEILTQALEGKTVSVSGGAPQILGTSSGGVEFDLTAIPPVDANAPVALDDYYVTAVAYAGTAINVLGNDTDPNGRSLTLSSTLTPIGTAVGTATVENNKIKYTPPALLFDSAMTAYTYTVNNSTGQSDTGILLISIIAEDVTGTDTGGTPVTGGTTLGYLGDGTAVSADSPGIGTLYIPNEANPHTIVYDTYVAQTYHPGCANSDPGTNAEIIACRNTGTMDANVTYVQRITSNTSSVKLDGASQAVISDNSSYKFAVTDTLILNPAFQATTLAGVPTRCQSTTGKTVSLYGATSPYYDLGCGLTNPKYVEFTATGTSGAQCGVGSFVCRGTVTIQER
jgi:hypothetical protein